MSGGWGSSRFFFKLAFGLSIVLSLNSLHGLEPEVGHKDHHRRLGLYPNATPEEIFEAVENLSIQYASRKGGLRKPIREFLESGEILLARTKYVDQLRNLRLRLGSLEDGSPVDLLMAAGGAEELIVGRPPPRMSAPSPKEAVSDFGIEGKKALFKAAKKHAVLLFRRSEAESYEADSHHEFSYIEVKNYTLYLRSILTEAFENGEPPKAFLNFVRGILSRSRREVFFLPSLGSAAYLNARGEFLRYLKRLQVFEHKPDPRDEKPKITSLVNDLQLFDIWMLGFGRYLEAPPKKKKRRADEEKRYMAEEDSDLLTYRKGYREFIPPEMIAVELGTLDSSFARGLVFRVAQDQVLNVLAIFQMNHGYWLERIREVQLAFNELKTSKVQFEAAIATLKQLETALQSGVGAKGPVSRCSRKLFQMSFLLGTMLKSS